MNTWNIDENGVKWIADENGNKCYVRYFGSEKLAEKALKSLENCENCINCSGCIGCSDCIRCSDCSRCSDCIGCSGLENHMPKKIEKPIVPKIENIHQKVYEAASQPNALNMSDWHICETTHCRAGWVVILAGEDGKKLETFHDTVLAASLIYRASSPLPVSMPRFYEDNKTAMEDMKRLAELEAAL